MRLPQLILPFAIVLGTLTSRAQTPDAPSILREAVQFQLEEYRAHPWGLQYRVHRVDTKDDSIREVIETADGNVSRTLTWRGRAFTPEEEDGEHKRLEALTPPEVQRRRARSQSSDKYAVELISAMPTAMAYTPAPGQPQLPDVPRTQLVLDFVPSPTFHPGTTTQEILTGLAGRMWIDSETHHMSRIDLRVTKNLNLMFGLLARVYEGGSLSYQQRPVADGHYCYTLITMDVKLRELMLHTAPYKQTLTVTDLHYFPTAPTVKEAVGMLLAVPSIKP